MTAIITPTTLDGKISIHMPHTWHDYQGHDLFPSEVIISIHMPHTWHDVRRIYYIDRGGNFNPHATYVA